MVGVGRAHLEVGEASDLAPPQRALIIKGLAHELLVVGPVVKVLLRRSAELCNRLDRLDRINSTEGLSAEHNTVAAIENGVGHIRGLSTRGTGRVDHGVDETRQNNRPGYGVAPQDALLLQVGHLLRLKVQPKIATGEQDAIGDRDDVLKIVNGGLSLDFRHDFRLRQPESIQQVPGLDHVMGTIAVAQADVVNLVPLPHIHDHLFVTLGEQGQRLVKILRVMFERGIAVGHQDHQRAGKRGVVQSHTLDLVLGHADDLEHQRATLGAR